MQDHEHQTIIEFQKAWESEIKEHGTYLRKHDPLLLEDMKIINLSLRKIVENKSFTFKSYAHFQDAVKEYEKEYHKWKYLLYLTLKFKTIKKLKSLIRRIKAIPYDKKLKFIPP